MTQAATVSPNDRTVVRDLARRVAEIAALPVMAERVAMWKRHNRLERVRPMVLVFPEGGWDELLGESACQCQDETLRPIELALRRRIYQHERINDDNVVSGQWLVAEAVAVGSWGLEPRRIPSTAQRGAWAFDPVLKTADDVKKIHAPQITYDPDESRRRLAFARDLFGDILDVQLTGPRHVSFHLMRYFTKVRGLDQTLLDMCDNPGLIHDVMAVLEEGNRQKIRRFEELNLLTLNNDGSYHSSGGVGFTDELPQADFDPAHVRPIDLWASAEAQELALVSPAMHEEFVLQYERRLLEPFGLNGYGCCEDLTRKLDLVLSIPRMRRVSISPFADVARCAEQIEDKCIFSWKPHPAFLVGKFEPDRLADYLRHALEATHGCVVEMILKDTHTCENRPERFTEWTRIARELADQF